MEELVGECNACAKICGWALPASVARPRAQEGVLPGMVEARYASYKQGVGQQIRAGKVRPFRA